MSQQHDTAKYKSKGNLYGNKKSLLPWCGVNKHIGKGMQYSDVIMGFMAPQITSLTIVYSLFIQAQMKKHQSATSLAFVRGIHRGPVNSPHKWPVTRKMFHFDDVIIELDMAASIHADFITVRTPG